MQTKAVTNRALNEEVQRKKVGVDNTVIIKNILYKLTYRRLRVHVRLCKYMHMTSMKPAKTSKKEVSEILLLPI